MKNHLKTQKHLLPMLFSVIHWSKSDFSSSKSLKITVFNILHQSCSRECEFWHARNFSFAESFCSFCSFVSLLVSFQLKCKTISRKEVLYIEIVIAELSKHVEFCSSVIKNIYLLSKCTRPPNLLAGDIL